VIKGRACYAASVDRPTKDKQDGFRNFVTSNVEPFAEAWDREQEMPDRAIAMLAEAGLY
jgi:hypothetical protein